MKIKGYSQIVQAIPKTNKDKKQSFQEVIMKGQLRKKGKK